MFASVIVFLLRAELFGFRGLLNILKFRIPLNRGYLSPFWVIGCVLSNSLHRAVLQYSDRLFCYQVLCSVIQDYISIVKLY